jgi:uncharacterized protein (DUF1684 family)
MTTPEGDAAGRIAVDRLALADWRRRIAELYAQVRAMSGLSAEEAHARWQAMREILYRSHASSPVPVDQRPGFRALHFPYDRSLRFELPVIREESPPAGETTSLSEGARAGVSLPISIGRPLAFERVGRLEVPFPAGQRPLALYWLPEYSGGLFLPFRDATNGVESYGGGRYLLDTAKGADLGGSSDAGTVVVDFNFAYQPSCAFDAQWSCPLSPPENRLDIEVRAGERIA